MFIWTSFSHEDRSYHLPNYWPSLLNHPVYKNCTLPDFNTETSSNSLPTFPFNLSVPSSGVKNPKSYIYMYIYICIKGVPGENVNILGGHIIGYSKQNIVKCTRVLIRTVSEIEIYHCAVAKLLINRHYVLFLMSVFIVQVTQSVQFTQYSTFSKVPPSTSMHFATRVRTWRVASLSASWCSFMLAITSIMRSSSSFCTLHSSSNPINKNLKGRSRAGVKDNIGRQIQTPVQWNSPISETVRNRTHVHTKFFA
jgi:hypothetical protein